MSKSPEKKSGKVNYVRVLAGGYLAYLGAQLLFGVGKSEMPMVGLIGGLVFVTKAIKEKKDTNARRARFAQGGTYLAVYLVLNVLRNFVF